MPCNRLTFTRGQDPSPLVSVGDVTYRTGLARDRVNHWIIRLEGHPKRGTPLPVALVAAGAVFWWPDWQEWLQTWRPEVWDAMDDEWKQ